MPSRLMYFLYLFILTRPFAKWWIRRNIPPDVLYIEGAAGRIFLSQCGMLWRIDGMDHYYYYRKQFEQFKVHVLSVGDGSYGRALLYKE